MFYKELLYELQWEKLKMVWELKDWVSSREGPHKENL